MAWPVKNAAYTFYVALVDTAARPAFKANPTLAAGDVQVSIDGGAFANLGTLPDAEPNAGRAVRVIMAQAEMNGDDIMIQFVDAAGAEWDDLIVHIQTTARGIDDVATQTSVNTIDDFIDTEVNAILTAVDTEVGAIKTKTDFLPSVTAGAAGGLFIAGSNAATSITTALTSNIVGNITGNLSGSVGSVTGLTASNLDATVSSRATQVSVDDLPTNAELATALGTADDAVLTAINDLPTNAELATALAAADDAVLAAIAALNNLSAAQVNAEVVDALATDTYAEPTGVPAATATLAVKIGRLHQALRNQVTVTGTKKQFFDDSAAALWEKDLSDDGTTYTETEGNAP